MLSKVCKRKAIDSEKISGTQTLRPAVLISRGKLMPALADGVY